MSNVQDIVYKYYTTLGGPGSFSGFDKIKMAIKQAGHSISDTDIKAALRRIETYNRFRHKHRTPLLPKHIPRRFAHVSGPGLWFFGDSLYIKKGWPGNLKFAQVWIDGFSRKLYARPLAVLSAKNTTKVLKLICEEDRNGQYPDVCYTDRGREFLGEFSHFLQEQSIRQIFTSAAQKNKAFLGIFFY